MFWRKENKEIKEMQAEELIDGNSLYTLRNCWIYISEKYKQILFVPMGKIDSTRSRELDEVVSREWPMSIDELQDCIEKTLNNYKGLVNDIWNNNDGWFSFKKSKAKSHSSFKVDYIEFFLETDLSKSYGKGEAERIIVKASPKDWSDDNYKIVGLEHLIEYKLAQVIIDIYNACEKIRN